MMGSEGTGREFNIAAGRGDCSPEINLWLAVLEQAIGNQPPESARKWLGSRDGQMVTAMAGVDADWVSRKLLSAAVPLTRKRRGIFAPGARSPRPGIQFAP